jgi:hypothetical protein
VEGGEIGRHGDAEIDRVGSAGRQRAIGVCRGADHPLPAGQLSAGIVGAKAWQRAVDQPRVAAHHLVRAEPKGCHAARPEVLDHNVGRRDQRQRCFPSAPRLEVELNTAFAAIPCGIGWCRQARSARRVDMHHIGALVGQQHRRQRPGDELPEIDHPDARQRSAHEAVPGRPIQNWSVPAAPDSSTTTCHSIRPLQFLNATGTGPRLGLDGEDLFEHFADGAGRFQHQGEPPAD